MSDPLRKRLLEKTFRYTKSGETDVAATFKRIRRQLKEAEAVRQAENITPIRGKGTAR